MLINTVWFIPYLTISTFFFPRSLSFCVHLPSSISRSAARLAHTNALEKWWKTENGFAKFKTRFKWMLRVWAVAGFAILGVSMMYDDVANFWVAEIEKILFHFGFFKENTLNSALSTHKLSSIFRWIVSGWKMIFISTKN